MPAAPIESELHPKSWTKNFLGCSSDSMGAAGMCCISKCDF